MLLDLATPLRPAELTADLLLALPAGSNAVVAWVDLDLLGDGRFRVDGLSAGLSRRHGVAFVAARPSASHVRVQARVADDGDLTLRLVQST